MLRPKPNVIHICTFKSLASDFAYAPSDRWAKMIQNEAYYWICFLMKGDKVSSDLVPTTREWAPLVGKITSIFAEYKIPTIERLTILSDQDILKKFVYDAFEVLRDVESCQDEKESSWLR